MKLRRLKHQRGRILWHRILLRWCYMQVVDEYAKKVDSWFVDSQPRESAERR